MWKGKVRCGRRGKARFGQAGTGEARFGRRGLARKGGVRQGKVRSGVVGCGRHGPNENKEGITWFTSGEQDIITRQIRQ